MDTKTQINGERKTAPETARPSRVLIAAAPDSANGSRLWKHDPKDSRCNCDFPRIWSAYPDECGLCMKLLPGAEDSQNKQISNNEQC